MGIFRKYMYSTCICKEEQQFMMIMECTVHVFVKGNGSVIVKRKIVFYLVNVP